MRLAYVRMRSDADDRTGRSKITVYMYLSADGAQRLGCTMVANNVLQISVHGFYTAE